MQQIYDLIILGAGPAGLTASIYASRYKINYLVLGKQIGGTANEAYKVENYPGIFEISGLQLMEKFQKHAKKFGAKILPEEVTKIVKENQNFKVITRQGKQFLSKTLILALGTQRRKLNVPGEDKFTGRGVAYCATCDAPLFKDKIVGVVGGGNAAVTSAILLSQYTKEVYLFVKDKTLNAEPAWIEQVNKNPKIKILFETNIKEISGNAKLTSVSIDKPLKGKTKFLLDGLFIEIGAVPAASLCQDLGIKVDERKFVIVGSDGSTNVAGVFAAGDLTSGSNYFAQILTAAAEGAIAANSVYKFLQGNK